jgi:hypothetical protein
LGRYDWPRSVIPTDDAAGRERHNRRVAPPPDVRAADGSLDPLPAELTRRQRRRRRGAVPRDAPTGGAELWLPIGPSAVVGGQATGRPRVAGRIRDLAVEPTVGDRAYAASGSGGVWFTSDRGITWSPLDEFAVSPNRDTLTPVGNTLACGAIHVVWGAANSDADDEVIVGTGEPGGSGGMPGGQLTGIGILRATGPASGTAWTVEAPSLRGEAVYRITERPDSRQEQFAATTDGLYHRPPGGAWAKVAALGLAGFSPPWDEHVIDVVVTKLTGPDRVRIWVARYSTLQVAEVAAPSAPNPLNLAGAAFQTVNLPNVNFGSRIVLAAVTADQVWVTGKRNRTGTETIDPAHLWRVNASAAMGSLAATEITGTPERVFMSAGDQSMYDMALSVHPVSTNRLYLAGAAINIDGEWNAALYRCDVAGTAATPTLIGRGVHADCHIVRLAASTSGGSTRSVWVGCDGGVFKSEANGDPDSFLGRNTGLSVLQPGFIANHPTNDGIVAVGMQDNGTCDRIGDTVWLERFLGDGGGVVYDPGHPNRYLRQYTKAHWSSSDGTGKAPVFRRDASAPTGQTTSEQAESNLARFYMACGAVAHDGTTHLAIGTDRVWYTPDWGQTWVTLPTGTDPRGGDNPDLAQDVLQPGTANGQYNDTVPTFLCCTSDYKGTMFKDSAGLLATRWSVRSDDAGFHRVRLLALWDGGLCVMTGRRPVGSSDRWTFTSDVVEQIRAAAAGAEQTAVDNADPVDFLPALDLVNDVTPHDPERGANGSCYLATVGGPGSGAGQEIDTLWWYDGDGKFVPCGLRRVHPRATFTGTRIVSPVLSVVVDPDDPDTVYAGTSVGVVKGTLTMVDNAGVEEPHWAWRIFANGLPEGAVHDLAFFRHDGVKLLRAALQSRGAWEVDLTATVTPTTYLRVFATDTRRRRPTPLSGPTTNGTPGVRWDASPDIVFDTTGNTSPTEGPTEVDLHEVRFAGEVGEFAAQAFEQRTFKVHVLVHHRWHASAPPANVKVALLRRDGPTNGDVPLGGIWATLVSIAGGGAVPGALPGGWVKAATQLVRPITAPVDARTPRAVTFDVDLSAVADDTRVTFLAVVMSADDQLTAEELLQEDGTAATTVEQLVRHSRHAAARTLRVE